MSENESNNKDYNFLYSNSLNGWIPRRFLQTWLKVKQTAMSEFPKKNNVRTSKIGNNTFYFLDDIVSVSNKNSKK